MLCDCQVNFLGTICTIPSTHITRPSLDTRHMAGPPRLAFTLTAANIGTFAASAFDSIGAYANTAGGTIAIAHRNTAIELIFIFMEAYPKLTPQCAVTSGPKLHNNARQAGSSYAAVCSRATTRSDGHAIFVATPDALWIANSLLGNGFQTCRRWFEADEPDGGRDRARPHGLGHAQRRGAAMASRRSGVPATRCSTG